jgi:uncharacterized protein (DUF58 family)
MSETGAVYIDIASLARLRHDAHGFSFLPRQPIHSLLSGRKRSRLRGRGLDFEELRHYRPGDDIRDMDWRVTNRTGKPHIRVYTEERDRQVILLVDQRLSMFFGSRHKMKSVSAAELAALSAWRVIAQGDRVGAITFNDTRISQARPARSERNLMAILADLSRMNQELRADADTDPNPGQLAAALAVAERMMGHDSLLVIISDFDGWNAAALASVKRIAQHNDLVAALIYDPLEQDISTAANLVVSDGRFQLQLEPQKQDLGDRFEAGFHSALDSLQKELRKHGMPVIPLNTVDPVFEQLRHQLGPH